MVRCLEVIHSIVNSKDKTTLEIVHAPSIMVKDPFFQLTKVRPTIDLTIAKKGLSVAERDEAPLALKEKQEGQKKKTKKNSILVASE